MRGKDCHCEEQIVGQASCLSIMDDGQDAHPTGNPSGAQRKRLLRFARNDNLSPLITECLRGTSPTFSSQPF